MAGESYGGRYIPVFAAAVYDQNRLLVKNGLRPINLKSIRIGTLRSMPARELELGYQLRPPRRQPLDRLLHYVSIVLRHCVYACFSHTDPGHPSVYSNEASRK